MALSYQDSANLMSDGNFKNRVKVACLHYADYILNEANTVPAHVTRLRWANNCVTAPDVTAAAITPTVVMDPAVQAAGLDPALGSTIADTDLQSAVENALNKMM